MRPTVETEDEILIGRAKMGEKAAYESLVRRYQHGIYRLCLQMTGAHPAADDLAQETFVRAYFALQSFKEGTHFRAWIRRIAVNASLNYLKLRKREEPLGDRPDDYPGAVFSSVNDSPHEQLLRNDAGRAVDKALQALPSKLRAVFILRAMESMSYEDISRSLGIPRGTVMSRLNRARGKLQKSLAGSLGRSQA
jgi:RNA polymerase sigma-70 factor (ECF subfamily)